MQLQRRYGREGWVSGVTQLWLPPETGGSTVAFDAGSTGCPEENSYHRGNLQKNKEKYSQNIIDRMASGPLSSPLALSNPYKQNRKTNKKLRYFIAKTFSTAWLAVPF